VWKAVVCGELKGEEALVVTFQRQKFGQTDENN
jgi:hypothetical protein